MGNRHVLSQSDAHFQHAERPLEPLIRLTIGEPRALAWVPGQEQLVVAARSGALSLVEPAFGSRFIEPLDFEPARMIIGEGKMAVVGRGGALELRTFPEGQPVWRVQTGLLAGFTLRWWRGGVAVVGDDAGMRRVIVHNLDGTIRARARVGARTALGSTGDGHLMLARSTQTGLVVVPFGKPLPDGPPTEHHLRFGENLSVVGAATGGVTVWAVPGSTPVNIKLYDVCNVALSGDGERVAMGTRTGGVAINSAKLGTGLRINPARVEGHEGPVTAMEFSPKGRWLATAAERCIVWGF